MAAAGSARPARPGRRCARTSAPSGYSGRRTGSWSPGRAAAPVALPPAPGASRRVGPKHVAARIVKATKATVLRQKQARHAGPTIGRQGRRAPPAAPQKQATAAPHAYFECSGIVRQGKSRMAQERAGHRQKRLQAVRTLRVLRHCARQGKSWSADERAAYRQKRLQAVRTLRMLRYCARQGKTWVAHELAAYRQKRLRAPPAASSGPEGLAVSCKLVRHP
jgi:hypothetical protein